MKLRYALLLSSAIWASSLSARAQGSFQNLGFEAATLVPVEFAPVQFAPAFPGWSGYIGGVQWTSALYNVLTLDASGISIIDRGFTNPYWSGPGGGIEGDYTAVLMAGVVNSVTPANVTLSQISLVPVTAQSLWFKAWEIGPGGPLTSLAVTLGGEGLSLRIEGRGTNYTLYAADVSALAGQTAELDFTAFASPPSVNYVFLDAIQFSDQAIPEPGVVGLSALGALFVAGRRNRQR